MNKYTYEEYLVDMDALLEMGAHEIEAEAPEKLGYTSLSIFFSAKVQTSI